MSLGVLLLFNLKLHGILGNNVRFYNPKWPIVQYSIRISANCSPAKINETLYRVVSSYHYNYDCENWLKIAKMAKWKNEFPKIDIDKSFECRKMNKFGCGVNYNNRYWVATQLALRCKLLFSVHLYFCGDITFEVKVMDLFTFPHRFSLRTNKRCACIAPFQCEISTSAIVQLGRIEIEVWMQLSI